MEYLRVLEAMDEACYCELTDVVELLSRTHAMQVVCSVANLGPVRYHDIESALDASSSTLSARLDELAAAGLLEREQYDEIPPRVEYDLTDDGWELAVRLEPVLEWASER